MVREFVDGWDAIQTLGEGTYGEVLLLVNRQTMEAVAAKVIDLKNADPLVTASIRKEVCIHRLLNHENVIKFYGHREEPHCHYIFLQYACGGELFDRIEPDIGMPHPEAHRYFSQILAAVEYLHSVGVAHRDLKPENVLLDENDNVKIADFGLATLFRHQGKERHLSRRCGTLSYVAPEVFSKTYKAEPSDIWSCGIILVAMLAGELPWNQPTGNCENYASWKDGDLSKSPWPKIEPVALSLLKKILAPNPELRYSIAQIKEHFWFKNKASGFHGVAKWDGSNIFYKKLCSDMNDGAYHKKDAFMPCCSQPELMMRIENDVTDNSTKTIDVLRNGVCFSQPSHPEHMILCSQLSTTQETNSQASAGKVVVRRMTRFCIKMDANSAAEELKAALDKLGYMWKKLAPGQVVVNTVDRRKTNLVFKATLLEMEDKILLDFRLSRGDGLEFKRHFLLIRNVMAHMIVKGPIIWPMISKSSCMES